MDVMLTNDSGNPANRAQMRCKASPRTAALPHFGRSDASHGFNPASGVYGDASTSLMQTALAPELRGAVSRDAVGGLAVTPFPRSGSFVSSPDVFLNSASRKKER